MPRLEIPAKIEGATLDEYRQRFERGDKAVLLAGIRFCLEQKIIAPEWIVDAWAKAHNSWASYKVKTFDEALGVGLRKGAHMHALKQRRLLKFAVWNAVENAHNRGRTIDNNLFAEVGKNMTPPIGKTRAKEYYKAARAALKRFPKAFEALLEPFALK